MDAPETQQDPPIEGPLQYGKSYAELSVDERIGFELEDFRRSYGERGPVVLQSWLGNLGADPHSRTTEYILGQADDYEHNQYPETASLSEDFRKHRLTADFLQGYKALLLAGDSTRYMVGQRSTHNPDNPEIPPSERYGYQEIRLSNLAAEQVDAGIVYYLFHKQPGEPDHELFFGHRFSDSILTPLDGRQIGRLRELGRDDGTVWNTVIADGSN